MQLNVGRFILMNEAFNICYYFENKQLFQCFVQAPLILPFKRTSLFWSRVIVLQQSQGWRLRLEGRKARGQAAKHVRLNTSPGNHCGYHCDTSWPASLLRTCPHLTFYYFIKSISTFRLVVYPDFKYGI